MTLMVADDNSRFTEIFLILIFDIKLYTRKVSYRPCIPILYDMMQFQLTFFIHLAQMSEKPCIWIAYTQHDEGKNRIGKTTINQAFQRKRHFPLSTMFHRKPVEHKWRKIIGHHHDSNHSDNCHRSQ